MRVLTVRQPWAWAIIHGGKDVENRVRNIAGDYRGPVLIHVAKADDDAAFAPEHPMHGLIFAPCPNRASVDHNRHHCHWCTHTAPSKYGHKGCIIGVVDLVDVHRPLWNHACTDDDTDGPCSLWAETAGWPYHLVLANPRALDEPLPYRGALGLRKTNFGIVGDRLVEYHEPCKSPCAGVYGCPPQCHMDPVARLVATS